MLSNVTDYFEEHPWVATSAVIALGLIAIKWKWRAKVIETETLAKIALEIVS